MKPRSNPSPTRRCAVYTRKSTSAGLEMEFNSLDAQREACVAYVERQPGWKLIDRRYDDGGFTGANVDRPAFQRLLADIDAGEIDVVVVYKVDRLSRSLLDFAKMMERFSGAGASFVSVTQNFSTADAMGRLTLNMLMSFAEFEREMIAERTRDKIAAARRKGKWTGGPVPFGYRLEGRRLEIEEAEADVVRKAFQLFVTHGQIARVAEMLNERGLTRRLHHSSGSRGDLWTKDSMSRVLRNPIYAGFTTYGSELNPGEHPAIIDMDSWNLVHSKLKGIRCPERPQALNPEYVLRGLLRCGQCGAAMSPGSTRKGQREYRYYRCVTRDKHGTCSMRAVGAPELELQVMRHVAAQIPAVAPPGEVAAALLERLSECLGELERARAAIPARIAAAAADASKYAEEVARSEGSAREVFEAKLRGSTEAIASEKERQAKVERELADLATLAKRHAETEWVAEALGDFEGVWEMMTAPNKSRLLALLVERVVITGDEVAVQLSELVLGAPALLARGEAAE